MGTPRHEVSGLREAGDHPAGRTITSFGTPELEKLGVTRATFYRWCDLYQSGGPEALEDRSPRPKRVWNRIPDRVRDQIVQLALNEPELSPRELATRFTDTKSYFVSEASVYRLLKAHDLIASPAFIVVKAADEFTDLPSLQWTPMLGFCAWGGVSDEQAPCISGGLQTRGS